MFIVRRKTYDRVVARAEHKAQLCENLKAEVEKLRKPAKLHRAEARAELLEESEASLRAEVAAHAATKGQLKAAVDKALATKVHYEALIANLMEQLRLR
jgi:hypothetical protein